MTFAMFLADKKVPIPEEFYHDPKLYDSNG